MSFFPDMNCHLISKHIYQGNKIFIVCRNTCCWLLKSTVADYANTLLLRLVMDSMTFRTRYRQKVLGANFPPFNIL